MQDFSYLFNHAENLEDLKRRYLKACKQFHPDCGGTDEEFKAMNAAYEAAKTRLEWLNSDASAEHEKTGESASWFINHLRPIVGLAGLDIEICGYFVWVGGETYRHRKAIKAAGYKFSRSKKRWYASPLVREDHKRRGTGATMGDIRLKYGSYRIASNPTAIATV